MYATKRYCCSFAPSQVLFDHAEFELARKDESSMFQWCLRTRNDS